MGLFYRRVTATPSECLVVMRGGRATSLGNGASVTLWPWDSCALVPTGAIEHGFQMHQETKDGINLRFKGIVIWRVVSPEVAATRFRFQASLDLTAVSTAIGDVCLGELRAIVAGMSMDECISRRKTVLTGQLKDTVVPAIEGDDDHPGWGIRIEVLQVAQVFCPDEELVEQLQAEARDALKKTATTSDIDTSRVLDLARIERDREVATRTTEIERQRLEEQKTVQQTKIAIDRELKLATLENHRRLEEARLATDSELKIVELEKRRLHEQMRIETEAALRRQELEHQIAAAEQELRLRELEAKVQAVVAASEAERERLQMEIRKEILPLEQLPEVSRHLAGIFKGARLSVYGQDGLVGQAGSALDLIVDRLREVYRPAS